MKTILRILAVAWIAMFVAALVARRRLVSRGEPDDDTVDLVGIMNGFELASRATAFRGGTILGWFGGGTLDLRGATLHEDGGRLEVRALFGGARIVVPPTWPVEPRVTAIFGGVGDTRDATAEPSGPTLVIDGWAAFGGVSIVSEAPDLDLGAAPGPDLDEVEPASSATGG